MTERKKSKWFTKSALEDRLIFMAIFIAILSIFIAFFLSEAGIISLSGNGITRPTTSGGCAFYRNTGIPCPTCFWTRAMEDFVKFRTTKAFVTQPAATICYITLLFVAFFSLLSAILGVNFVFLPSVRLWRADYIAITAAIIGLAGWIITIFRTMDGK
ncbi:MAG: DUF2752 domain-containing protein [Planctomycetaceae bacterium]|nr:DUF2752 domain-containing protein [Planctomycetaceae bacterium]